MNSSMTRPPNRSGGGVQRTFGVEEEFLLVDATTGQPVPAAEACLAKAAPQLPETSGGPSLALEVQREQIEAVGPVCSTLQEVIAGIREGRRLADEAARSVGARAVAVATSPVPATPTLVAQPRFLNMATRFGLTLREQLTCGFHVHVGVTDGEEGVAVLDRIRVWLPVLLALSANSPFWQGADTGYASFRYQAWNRWPTAGPCERFGSEREYHRYVQSLLTTGVLLDEGMVYFDARLSRNHPTVEVRIADVCMEASHAAAIAAIVRALVERAAQEWRAGISAPRLSAGQLSPGGVEGKSIRSRRHPPAPPAEHSMPGRRSGPVPPLPYPASPGRQRGRGASDSGSGPDPELRHRCTPAARDHDEHPEPARRGARGRPTHARDRPGPASPVPAPAN